MASRETSMKNLKARLKVKRINGTPVNEVWFMKVCGALNLDPEHAKRTCANNGWLVRSSRNRFFPATNLVSKK